MIQNVSQILRETLIERAWTRARWSRPVTNIPMLRKQKLLLLAALSSSAACGDYGAEDWQQTPAVDIVQEALASGTNGVSLPERDLWYTLRQVCWENLDANQATRRQKIREGAELWTAATNNGLRFEGWDTVCSSSSNAIKMRFRDRSNCVSSNGIIFDDDASNTYSKFCGAHEMGHHIGFAHEHNRFEDRLCPNGEREEAGGGTGDLGIGAVDHDSIMSYCSGNPTALTQADIDGAQKFFGGGPSVKHGKNYALRFQDKKYLFLDPTGTSVIRRNTITHLDTGIRHVFNVRKQSGTGNIAYGDRISLDVGTRIHDDSTVVCSRHGCEASPGPDNLPAASRYLCPINGGSAIGGSDSPCYWQVKRTAGGNGAAIVDINDPIRLELDGVRLMSGTERDARFTGDFSPTQVETYSGPVFIYQDVDEQSYALRSDQDSVSRFCHERGYYGGTVTSAYCTGQLLPAQLASWNDDDSTPPWFLTSGDWEATSSTGSCASYRIDCAR